MWAGALLALISVLLVPIQTDEIRDEVESSTVTGDVDALVNAAIGIGIFFGLVGAGLWIWMAIMNGKGANWARITATVFGGIYLALGAFGLAFGAVFGSGTTLNMAITAITLVIAIVAIVMMWQASSSQWYAQKG